MEKLENLTNEKIHKKCPNNFELTNFAIRLAQNHIAKGEFRILSELMHELNDCVSINLQNLPKVEPIVENEENY